MGQRSEVAAGSNRPAAGHPWNHISIETVHNQVEHFTPHTGISAQKRVEAKHHNAANSHSTQRLADSRTVRENKVSLQGHHLVGRDSLIAQFPESGVNAVESMLVDHRPTLLNPLMNMFGNRYGNAAGNSLEVFKSETFAAQNHTTHRAESSSPSALVPPDIRVFRRTLRPAHWHW